LPNGAHAVGQFAHFGEAESESPRSRKRESKMKSHFLIVARLAFLMLFLMALAVSACKKADEPTTSQSHPARLKKPSDVQN
jgi:hypothetical protein